LRPSSRRAAPAVARAWSRGAPRSAPEAGGELRTRPGAGSRGNGPDGRGGGGTAGSREPSSWHGASGTEEGPGRHGFGTIWRPTRHIFLDTLEAGGGL